MCTAVRAFLAAAGVGMAILGAFALDAGWTEEVDACPASGGRWFVLCGFGTSCAVAFGAVVDGDAGARAFQATSAVWPTLALWGCVVWAQQCEAMRGNLLQAASITYCLIAWFAVNVVWSMVLRHICAQDVPVEDVPIRV
jgi:hypothetical protein